MSHSPVFAADQEPVGPGHLLLADHLADPTHPLLHHYWRGYLWSFIFLPKAMRNSCLFVVWDLMVGSDCKP